MALTIVVLVLATALSCHPGAISSSDGTSMYEVARSIVDHFDLSISHGVIWQGVDGRYYSPFGIGLSLVAILPYMVFVLIHHAVPLPDQVAEAFVGASMPLIVALLAGSLYVLGRQLGGSARIAVLVGLGAVGGTFLFVYSKDFFSEPLVALLLVVSVMCATKKRHGGAAAALAGAALTRPQFLALAPVWLWRSYVDGGWSGCARGTIPIVAAAAVDVLYNFARFGDPLNFGYSTAELRQGFTTPLIVGATGLLMDPEKSALLFAPIVVLIPFGLGHVWRTSRTAFWMLTSNLVVTFCLSATWWAWGGGWVWGPRLLIPAIIPSLATLAPWAGSGRWKTPAIAALLAAGLATNTGGALVDVGMQLHDQPRPVQGPQIARQYELLPDALGFTVANLYARQPAEPYRYLSLWQVRVAREWGPRAFGAAVGLTLVLIGGAVGSLLLLLRLLKTMPPEYSGERVAAAPSRSVSRR